MLGTVFQLTVDGSLKTLHPFDGADGAYPAGPMMQASNGKFYGTTQAGGSSTVCFFFGSCGTIFQMTPSGTLTTLHSFDASDGSLPGYGGALVEGVDGNLYGTTTSDGGNTSNGGTVFEITSAGKFTTLYRFCSLPNCADGASPVESLVQASDGNLYGTTYLGGNSGNGGTIFRLSPQGVVATLYDFCSLQNCADGSWPQAQLIQGTDGNFYGTTANGGGPTNSGTVFRFSMGLSPFAKLVFNFGKVGQADGILGQGFNGTTGVLFNGTPASFTVVSDTVIRTTVPAGATTGSVTVATASGTLKSNVPFRVMP